MSARRPSLEVRHVNEQTLRNRPDGFRTLRREHDRRACGVNARAEPKAKP